MMSSNTDDESDPQHFSQSVDDEGNVTREDANVTPGNSLENMDANNKLEDAPDPRDNNIFFHIVYRNWNRVLEMLQTENGCQQVIQDREALHMACQRVGVPLNVVQALLKVEPNGAKTMSGFGLPLHYALYKKNTFDVIKSLIDAHPEGVNQKNELGMLPLHLAAAHSKYENVIQLLLDMYPDGLKQQDEKGNLPIHEAIRENRNYNVLKLLIKGYSEGLKVCNNDGQLPLHCAAWDDPLPYKIKLLLDIYPEGANIYDRKGWLSIHLACARMRCSKKKKERETLYMLIRACPETIAMTCPTNEREQPTCYSSPLEIVTKTDSAFYGFWDMTKMYPAPLNLLDFFIKAEEMYFISLAHRMVTSPTPKTNDLPQQQKVR